MRTRRWAPQAATTVLVVLTLLVVLSIHGSFGGRAAAEAALQATVPDSGAMGDEGETSPSALAAPVEQLYVIGHLGPDEDPAFLGTTSDIWAYGEFAYVGTFSCSAQGVKVIDLSDPSAPRLAGTIPAPTNSRINDVKVTRVTTPFFDGVLLAHSDESCEAGGLQGFHLYDVTDPTRPALLSYFPTGDVHNLYLYAGEGRAYVLLAIPFGEVFGTGGHPFSDLLIVNVTEPSDPRLESAWTIGRDGGLAFGSPGFTGPVLPPGSDCTPPPGTPMLCRGDFPAVFLHDVWAGEDGKVAYLSYWDAGLVLLNISDPADPVLLGYAVEPATFGSDEGNAHAAVPARGGDLVLVADEDFQAEPYGFLRVFDTSDPANPTQIGAFATDNALGLAPGGDTIHNVYVVGEVAFLSWYQEGIRVVDFSEPTNPQEIAAFLGSGSFWGVYVVGNRAQLGSEELLVLGSDLSLGFHALGFDRSPPLTSHILGGELGESGWYVSNVTVTLDAVDTRSGVATTSYRVDGTAWRTYGAPFRVEGDGGHTFEFFSIDNAGHSEDPQSAAIQVDTTPPVLEVLSPSGTVTRSEVSVSWNSQDATSGLLRFEVEVDEGGLQAVGLQDSVSLTLPDGSHEVRVVAVDIAGNRAEAEVRFSVDTNPFSPSGPYGGIPLYGLIAGALVAAVILVRFVRRRGRQRSSEAGRGEGDSTPRGVG